MPQSTNAEQRRRIVELLLELEPMTAESLHFALLRQWETQKYPATVRLLAGLLADGLLECYSGSYVVAPDVFLYDAASCPGKPCGTECDHVGR